MVTARILFEAPILLACSKILRRAESWCMGQIVFMSVRKTQVGARSDLLTLPVIPCLNLQLCINDGTKDVHCYDWKEKVLRVKKAEDNTKCKASGPVPDCASCREKVRSGRPCKEHFNLHSAIAGQVHKTVGWALVH